MTSAARIATVTLNPAIDQTVFIPHFAAGKVNRVASHQSDPGGKGVNVASILADLGYAVSVTGFLGTENAQIFERLFVQKQITDRFVRIAGSTRTGIKIVNEIERETTDINFPGQMPTEKDVTALFAIVDELARDCDWFVLAGSIPADLSSGVYRDLVQAIRAQGKAVALDTSGEGFRQALPVLPTLIKPNIDELQEYTGQRLASQADIVRVARGLVAQGITSVIVSMGAEGAIFVEEREAVLARPPQVKVISTVGAGDAMVAGSVAAKVRGLSLAECARLATAFSAGVITHLGPGLPSQDTVASFMDQVRVQQLT